MRVLPVSLPPPTGRRSDTRNRVAHRIAALFGVDLGGTPGGQVWCMSYDALTLAEIGRSGPLPSRGWHLAWHEGTKASIGDSPLLPANTWWIAGHGLVRGTGGDRTSPAAAEGLLRVEESVREIAPATLNRFGPDRKAAMVLSGANALFAGLLPVIDQVLATILATQDELHPRVRLTIWAQLVLEAYRSQPALFAAAVQARGIQRSLTAPWAPVVTPGSPAARGEYGSPDVVANPPDAELAPRELDVIDATLNATGLRFHPSPEANEDYLREDVVARWTKHLLVSADRGVVWVAEPSPGKRQAEVLLSTLDSTVSLLDEAPGLRGPLPLDDPEQWRTLCPGVPTPEHVHQLGEREQVALIWTLMQVFRTQRSDPAFDFPAFQRHVTGQLDRLVTLAETVLGPVHLLTHAVRNRHAAARHRDLCATDPAAAADAAAETSRTLARIGELRHAGQVAGGFYAELLVGSSQVIRTSMSDALARGDAATAAGIEEDLRWLWDEVFATVGIDLAAELESADDGAPGPALAALAPHVHNYVAFLQATPRPDDHARAVRLVEDIVLPARASTASARRMDRPLRLSLQVAVRTIDTFLADPDRDPAEVGRWSLRAWEHAARLETIPFVAETLEETGTLTEARIAALTAVVTGWLIALEHEVPGSGVNLDRVRAQLSRLQELRGVRSPDQAAHSDAQRRVLDLATRLAAVEVTLEAQAILAHARFTGTGAAVAVRGAADDARRWEVPLADAALFTALRGVARRGVDAWPVLELGWSAEHDGTLTLLVDEQPLLSPDVAAITVVVRVAGVTYQAPLVWEERAGHPVVLHAVLTGVPQPGPQAPEVEVIVRGHRG